MTRFVIDPDVVAAHLTQLQADAFVGRDSALARTVGNTATAASIDELRGSA